MKVTKADLEQRIRVLEEGKRTLEDSKIALYEINRTQVGRLVDRDLLETRIRELEGHLDDAIDERDKAKAECEKWRTEAERLASARGMVAR